MSTAISQKYDLEERTAKFGEDVIKFCQKTPNNIIVNPLIDQLVRAATSVGANYCEADNAESKKDFKHKIGICKKEAREAKYFLRVIAVATPAMEDEAGFLQQEARELNLIFNAIYHKLS